jgi:hypothetical protein
MKVLEELWLQISATMAQFGGKFTATDPQLIVEIFRSENSTFPLRGYIAFRRSQVGEEIVISVDVRSQGGLLSISSDLCAEGGVLLASGPGKSIPESEDESGLNAGVENWLSDFELFLLENESQVLRATADLK